MAVLIREFKSTNSSSLDGISSRLIKAAGPGIIDPLLHIFNQSINTGIFPSGLKIGSVTPLFKEGDASDPSNYRPISILPSLVNY